MVWAFQPLGTYPGCRWSECSTTTSVNFFVSAFLLSLSSSTTERMYIPSTISWSEIVYTMLGFHTINWRAENGYVQIWHVTVILGNSLFCGLAHLAFQSFHWFECTRFTKKKLASPDCGTQFMVVFTDLSLTTKIYAREILCWCRFFSEPYPWKFALQECGAIRYTWVLLRLCCWPSGPPYTLVV